MFINFFNSSCLNEKIVTCDVVSRQSLSHIEDHSHALVLLRGSSIVFPCVDLQVPYMRWNSNPGSPNRYAILGGLRWDVTEWDPNHEIASATYQQWHWAQGCKGADGPPTYPTVSWWQLACLSSFELVYHHSHQISKWMVLEIIFIIILCQFPYHTGILWPPLWTWKHQQGEEPQSKHLFCP